jgi:pimeloyl-ACP methyl ester carboxylesterase
MKQIVVAGHSMGGQMTQRYAVVGKPLGLTGSLKTLRAIDPLPNHIIVPITYWVGNPNSFAWLDSSRPVAPAASCPGYDDWASGLDKYGTGNHTYNAAIGLDPILIRTNYALKSIAYARGLADHGNANLGECGPDSQG